MEAGFWPHAGAVRSAGCNVPAAQVQVETVISLRAGLTFTGRHGKGIPAAERYGA
jgi:hypothetical protein